MVGEIIQAGIGLNLHIMGNIITIGNDTAIYHYELTL